MNEDKVGCLEVLGLFIGIAIIFALACWVGNSDLPSWLKYYLLS